MLNRRQFLASLGAGACTLALPRGRARPVIADKTRISGIYPHLAVFNQGGECGIGAVAPWAGRLWCITYPPHSPGGSDDKLYAIDPDLSRDTRPESVGGTHANRMIHPETGQLLIGRYLIDRDRNVRVLDPERFPGRLTACARHLEEPERLVYYYGMEGRLYEVDVETLEVTQLTEKLSGKLGAHGKAAVTGQDRMVICNNGIEPGRSDIRKQKPFFDPEVGALAEFDGQEWETIERRQYTAAARPGGIGSRPSSGEPLWASGWDHRSVTLKVRHKDRWHTYRLPKGSYTYDAFHGWYTEWPRIRQVNDDLTLMNVHGTFFRFPSGFRPSNSGGIRPLAYHLKMVVDYCEWQGRLVCGCNDATKMQNPLVNQSQSNLWFLNPSRLDDVGPREGWGGPWVHDDVEEGQVSEPFLVAEYPRRVLHLSHGADHSVEFAVQLDAEGNGSWEHYRTVTIGAEGYGYKVLPAELDAEWARVKAQRGAPDATAYFHCSDDRREFAAGDRQDMFRSLAGSDAAGRMCGGIVRPRGGGLGTLQFIARTPKGDDGVEERQYSVDESMTMQRLRDPDAAEWFKGRGEVEELDYDVDRASAILREDGEAYRVPRLHDIYDGRLPAGWPRGKREVVTERSLWNCHGTFYEIPRPSSGGLLRMRPVCTHGRLITDFCSWRGLLVLAGTRPDAEPDGHYVSSEDGRAGLWFGTVDDLWKLGKPRGQGGPWLNTPVKAEEPSDSYLMTGYDRRKMVLSHDADRTVSFRIEVDVVADGTWETYNTFEVPAGKKVQHAFPRGYSAHWLRAVVDTDCRATVQLEYS